MSDEIVLSYAAAKREYIDRAYRKSESDSSKNSCRYALTTFENFILERYGRSIDEVLLQVRQGKVDPYRILDAFVSYMSAKKLRSGPIHTIMTWVKGFLVYVDIDINPYKFKQKVFMPKKVV
jgi:hypothetical protein